MSEPSATGPRTGEDGRARCPWGVSTPDYVEYHDTEWGRAVHGDDALFERICLEAFQSGLSWITILRRRETFRAAFRHFVIDEVAAFTDADRERLLGDPGIIRNRAKIDAAIANAAAAQQVRTTYDGGLDALVWSYAPDPAARPAPRTTADVPASTPESLALSKDLKKRGFRFVGPTTAYALMQACGLVNDHLEGCFAR
ncbi:DNA-3-methyladenine glycosylase I [Actinacidiphila acidipaludis]|uniref:DNA-3-methyladenine glycosylase I n=1 Tax=Actinacidiphila acidipaludis TaxID=2873382 RepID=A0ABS7Q1J9_9ACTN|nr:DNA-3-methyladenine glycosylase I [Streptomyces acidipaludis]MBY8877011.1 DNA-3-methyladenine glycosylase I [Streptomyces acidipaludis]